MEEEFTELRGEDSRQSLIAKHHKHNLVAPTIPQHLVASLHGFDDDYSQFANFPWDPMVCYMLDAPTDVRPPATFIEYGMTTDFFGTFARSNGYNDMGGIVACSGGIFKAHRGCTEGGAPCRAGSSLQSAAGGVCCG